MRTLMKFKKAAAVGAATMPFMAFAQWTPKVDGTNLPEGGGGGIVEVISNIMKFLLKILAILAVIAFVIAGIIYLTSAGDQEQMDRGKRTMIAAVIGLIVALLGLIVINTVQTLLSGGGGGGNGGATQ